MPKSARSSPIHAAPARPGYGIVAPMDDRTLPQLENLRPAIKARWNILLHAHRQAGNPRLGVVIPEMLILMVDGTLDRLVGRITESGHLNHRSNSLAPFGAGRASCKCGLQLLLTYYIAGAKALREILPVDLGAERVKILHRFNQIAHDEMESLCGICLHRGGPMCSLRPELPVG